MAVVVVVFGLVVFLCERGTRGGEGDGERERGREGGGRERDKAKVSW